MPITADQITDYRARIDQGNWTSIDVLALLDEVERVQRAYKGAGNEHQNLVDAVCDFYEAKTGREACGYLPDLLRQLTNDERSGG